jgi:hypothetical protein
MINNTQQSNPNYNVNSKLKHNSSQNVMNRTPLAPKQNDKTFSNLKDKHSLTPLKYANMTNSKIKKADLEENKIQEKGHETDDDFYYNNDQQIPSADEEQTPKLATFNPLLSLDNSEDQLVDENTLDKLKKAEDFFENEKLIYIHITDVNNREKIQSYLSEGLFFID